MNNYLITGGAGSIGGALTKRLLEEESTAVVRVFSHNDSEQHEFLQTIPTKNRERLRLILGDVRDRDAVRRAIRGVSHVYHCAAIKHVPAANYSAEECASVNIQGTACVLACAQAEGVTERTRIPMTLLSTDKAVDPSNVMGATKAVAEQIVLRASWADFVIRRVVRFGNVFDSRGSLFPTLVNNLRRNLPVIITAYDATRYVVPIVNAVELLMRAGHWIPTEPFIMVPRMRSISVRHILNMALLHVKRGDTDFTLPKESGLLPGEKLHERCISDHELNFISQYDDSCVLIGDKKRNTSCPWIDQLLSSKTCERALAEDMALYYTQ